jgi:hypothetical protein
MCILATKSTKVKKAKKTKKAMRYCIVNREKFLTAGGVSVGHYENGTKIIINENELIRDRALGKTFEEWLAELDGEAYDTPQIKRIINSGGYKLKLL